jgi:hypothetical protein
MNEMLVIPNIIRKSAFFVMPQELTPIYLLRARGELVLGVMSEIRSQLKPQLEIFNFLLYLTAAAEFQKEVLESIGTKTLFPGSRALRLSYRMVHPRDPGGRGYVWSLFRNLVPGGTPEGREKQG